MSQIYSFFVAVQFLTRIPCPQYEFREEYIVNSLLYYPVVGLIIGLFLAAAQLLLQNVFPPSITAALLIALYVLLTGGLHIDGLIDTVDGLFSNRTKEEILEIMKDSRVGAFGVIGAITVILVKFSFYQELGTHIPLFGFILVSVVNRWSLTLLVTTFPYVRKAGLGSYFQKQSSKKYFWLATMLTLIIVFFLEWVIGLFLLSSTALLSWLYGKIITTALGGMTGDTYGAFVELLEIYNFILLIVFLPLVGF